MNKNHIEHYFRLLKEILSLSHNWNYINLLNCIIKKENITHMLFGSKIKEGI